MSFYSSYFSLSQVALFTAVPTPFYIYFIAFVVPSKVLIEVSTIYGFLLKNRFFVSQAFLSPLFASHPGKNSNWSENVCAWSLYVYETLIILAIFDLSHESASKNFVFTDCSVLTDSTFYFALPLLLCLIGFLCSIKHQWL